MPGLRGGVRFRQRGIAERLADRFPTSGPAGALRAAFGPLFRRVLEPSGPMVATLPYAERLRVAAAYRHITWNPTEYAAFRAAVRPGAVALDIGANVGAYTMLFALWAGSDGRVHAFEPDPRACDGLREHLRINHLLDRVSVVQAAVSDRPGAAVPFVVDRSSGLSRLGAAAAARIDVAATTIDDFCVQHGIVPDVIKVDVEGAELAVLRGAEGTIAAAGRRLHLFVEMHPDLWTHFGHGVAEMDHACRTLRVVPEALIGGNPWAASGVCVRLRPVER